MSKKEHRLYFCEDGAILDTQIKDGEDVKDTLNRCFKKISDLEAKLAESEEEIKVVDEDRQFKAEMWTRFADKCKDLEQQLAEKEKEIEKITKIVAYRDDMDRSTTINGVKFSDEQIITLQNIDYFADKHNQDKISFAVEQLDKVKELLKSFDGNYNGSIDCCETDILNIIDNQIKQLKEMK